MNVQLPGLTKDEVDKSCTSGNPRCVSEAPSIMSHLRKPGRMTYLKNINESSLLHLRNRRLSGDYSLPCSPPRTPLTHRHVEVKMLFNISLDLPCAATYLLYVDHGKDISCFDTADICPDFNALSDRDTPSNKLLNVLVEYWDVPYLKCCFGKPIICRILIGPQGQIDDLMLTMRYGKYPETESWCKAIEMWMRKMSKFVVIKVGIPTFYLNAHHYENVELFNSHSSDLMRTQHTPLLNIEIYSNEGWEDREEIEKGPSAGSHNSDVVKSDKDESVAIEVIKSPCSKMFEFIGETPRSTPKNSLFLKTDIENMKNSLKQSNSKSFKSTDTLFTVINVDDKVYVIGALT